ncbi:hypothetical protein [Bacteroides caecimuris]|uniref:hypothetical protein n=1 Tax=Bacteroides caecimuris TaxID=1796613 RepID=UPI000EA2FDE2|nr:hypothetical protein [Bacteroides caecimuris]
MYQQGNDQKLSELEKAQIEFLKGKAEFMQGCGGCLMIPVILVVLFCLLILVAMIVGPFMD